MHADDWRAGFVVVATVSTLRADLNKEANRVQESMLRLLQWKLAVGLAKSSWPEKVNNVHSAELCAHDFEVAVWSIVFNVQGRGSLQRYDGSRTLIVQHK